MAEVEQDRLEGADVAVGLDHRPADGVLGGVGLGDRAVEEAQGVVPLEVGGVGEHEVGVGGDLGGVGVGDDDLRDEVLAGGVGGGEHLHGLGGVHRRVPGHVGHVEEEHLDRVGVGGHGVGDDHVHHAVGGERRLPGEGLVDALRAAVGVDGEILGAARIAEVRAVERLAGGDLVVRLGVDGDGLGVGRLEAEAAGGLDRAEEDLQEVDGAAGLEAVGVGGDAAHGVEGDRAAGHRFVALPRKSVQGRSSVIASSKAVRARRAARRRMSPGRGRRRGRPPPARARGRGRPRP